MCKHISKLKKLVHILIAAIAVLCLSVNASAKADSTYVLLPDSSNFVKASLVVVSPGNNIYSSLGHCAIHLECPVHDLDYYFSFGTYTADDYTVLQFFAGTLKAQYLSFKPELFLLDYINEEREVKEVELNLNLHEQQRLWQLLDEELANTDKYKFNYLNTNCTSMSLRAIEWSLINEQLEFGKWPEPMTWNNGECASYHTRHQPWLTFINNSLMGVAADDFYDQEERMSPEVIIPVLESARIVPNDGGKPRPVFKGKPVTILPLKQPITPSPITPMVIFSALLAVVIVITLLEWHLKWRLPAQITDSILLVSQTVIGLLLMYMSFVTCLFGLHWNWYLIVFNPIPVIVWLLWRNKIDKKRLYAFYFVVLLTFVALTPFSTQLDIEHQLITLTFAVRCASKWMQSRQHKK